MTAIQNTSIAWYKNQLEARGLTEPVAQHAGFRLMARQPFNGYEMPYFDVDGAQTAVSTFRRHIPDEFMADYQRRMALHLEDPATHAKPELPADHIRLSGLKSGIEPPYWPRVMHVDHRKSMQDISTGILITNGEEQSLCAQMQVLKEGLPFSCVALGGIDKWPSFINHFRHFGYCASASGKTVRRPIIISMDWNRENYAAQAAEDALYDFFASTGAVVTILRWPINGSMGEQKLDEYIVGGGSIMSAIEHSVQLDINPMNRRYFNARYAKFEGGVIRLSDAARLTTAQFTSQYSHLNSIVTSPSGRVARAYHAKEWLDNPYVPVVTGTFFEPWGIWETRESPHLRGTELNLFSGWGCVPEAGDIEPFHKLIDNLFKEPAHKDWALQWIAHLVQRPNDICSTYLALSSILHGTGKGLFARTLRLMVGERYCVAGTKEAWIGRFNGEWEGKLLVLTDELMMSKPEDRRRMGERVKGIVGNPVISIEKRGEMPAEHHNPIRFVFTGKSDKIAHLDPADRRAAVFESITALDPDFGEQYDRWLRAPGIRAALLHYFGHLDLSAWNPGAPAIKTLARLASVQSSAGPLMAFIEDLQANIILPDRDIATPDEIVAAYELSTGTHWPSGKASLCSALRRHGAIISRACPRTGRDAPVYHVNGKNIRLWIIRDFDKYAAVDPSSFSASYKRQIGQT